jgi:hypothetical protein
MIIVLLKSANAHVSYSNNTVTQRYNITLLLSNDQNSSSPNSSSSAAGGIEAAAAEASLLSPPEASGMGLHSILSLQSTPPQYVSQKRL